MLLILQKKMYLTENSEQAENVQREKDEKLISQNNRQKMQTYKNQYRKKR